MDVSDDSERANRAGEAVKGEVEMLPKWPPIHAGPTALSALLGRPFGEHIEFPPKHPNHSLTAAIISEMWRLVFSVPLKKLM